MNAKYLNIWSLHLYTEYAEAITPIHKLKTAVTVRAGQKKLMKPNSPGELAGSV